MRKPRVELEVYNDLDGAVVSLFRVLRDPAAAERLAQLVALTPFSTEEFEAAQAGKRHAWAGERDPIERARLLLASTWLSHGSNGASGMWRTGFRRVTSANRNAMPARDWAGIPDVVRATGERFRGVVVECMDALDLMRRYDGPGVLFYVDPPYPTSTRGRWANAAYRHDLTVEQHRHLGAVLHELQGAVILSGYACPLYDDELYSSWVRVERAALADGARKRTEVLWLNHAAERVGLFA